MFESTSRFHSKFYLKKLRPTHANKNTKAIPIPKYARTSLGANRPDKIEKDNFCAVLNYIKAKIQNYAACFFWYSNTLSNTGYVLNHTCHRYQTHDVQGLGLARHNR
jgi:hypothetical protein